jgi:hypothetical protein
MIFRRSKRRQTSRSQYKKRTRRIKGSGPTKGNKYTNKSNAYEKTNDHPVKSNAYAPTYEQSNAYEKTNDHPVKSNTSHSKSPSSSPKLCNINIDSDNYFIISHIRILISQLVTDYRDTDISNRRKSEIEIITKKLNGTFVPPYSIYNIPALQQKLGNIQNKHIKTSEMKKEMQDLQEKINGEFKPNYEEEAPALQVKLAKLIQEENSNNEHHVNVIKPKTINFKIPHGTSIPNIQEELLKIITDRNKRSHPPKVCFTYLINNAINTIAGNPELLSELKTEHIILKVFQTYHNQ